MTCILSSVFQHPNQQHFCWTQTTKARSTNRGHAESKHDRCIVFSSLDQCVQKVYQKTAGGQQYVISGQDTEVILERLPHSEGYCLNPKNTMTNLTVAYLIHGPQSNEASETSMAEHRRTLKPIDYNQLIIASSDQKCRLIQALKNCRVMLVRCIDRTKNVLPMHCIWATSI